MWSVGKEVVRKHQESHSTSYVNVKENGSVLTMMTMTMKMIFSFSLALFPSVLLIILACQHLHQLHQFHTTCLSLILAIGFTVERGHAKRIQHMDKHASANLVIPIFSRFLSSLASMTVPLEMIAKIREFGFQILLHHLHLHQRHLQFLIPIIKVMTTMEVRVTSINNLESIYWIETFLCKTCFTFQFFHTGSYIIYAQEFPLDGYLSGLCSCGFTQLGRGDDISHSLADLQLDTSSITSPSYFIHFARFICTTYV